MNPRSSPPCGLGNLIKSRPLGLQAPLSPARSDLGSFTIEGEGGAPRCKIVVRFARGMVRRRDECRPLAPGIPTFRARHYRPQAQGITDSPRKNGAEYRPLAQVIPTSRARPRRETPANRCILPIGSPFHVVVVCVLVFCCSKKSGG